MLETSYIAVFLIGLLGGVQCVSMCGGVVGALSAQLEQPLRRVNAATAGHARQWSLHFAYSLGRIFSYVLFGSVLGALGSASLLSDKVIPAQITFYVLVNLMLVAFGLYLFGFTRLLAPFERVGQMLWHRIQPMTRHFLPVRSVARALPLGMLWGFLPCGMVYSVLITALLTGSALRGGGLMLAFGLGTLPNLLLTGWVAGRFRGFSGNGKVRLVAGLLILGFAVAGLVRAPSLSRDLWYKTIWLMICH